MATVFSLFLLMAFILSFQRTVYGCCFLLASRILIPEFVRLSIIDISLNTGIILILFFCSCRDLVLKKYNWRILLRDKYLLYIVLFILYWAVSLPLSNYEDFRFQLSYLIQFCLTDLLPVICFIIGIRSINDLSLVMKTLLVSSGISCLWGIMSIYIGNNIYVNILRMIYDPASFVDVAGGLSSERGYLSTSATFAHANGWGYFLPVAFVLAFYVNSRDRKRILLFLLGLLSIGVIICSKRSAFVAYFVFWCLYFYFSNYLIKKRIIMYLSIGMSVALLFVFFVPQLASIRGMIESSLFFWDDSLADRNNIGGSNMGMRINQVLYSFIEVEDNLLLGNGFGWSRYYLENTGSAHPILFGFETISSEAVCNGGIWGLLMWMGMFVISYQYSIQNAYSKDHIHFCRILTLVQLTIAVATGLAYFIFYGTFIVVLNKISKFRYLC